MAAPCLIGTSGWHYDHWKGVFYPEGTAASGRLAYYGSHFPTVEINNTFYQLPQPATFRQWRQAVPEDFVFAVKGSRLLSHVKKLNQPEEPLANFLAAARHLEEKLGPVLWQFPPNWRINLERLAHFLALLPPEIRFAFEFRNPSWFDERVYELLSHRGMAWCIYDLAGIYCPPQITADWGYIRMHGPGEPYAHRYSRSQLRPWAERIAEFLARGLEFYVYFNNDACGYAVENARELAQLLVRLGAVPQAAVRG